MNWNVVATLNENGIDRTEKALHPAGSLLQYNSHPLNSIYPREDQ